MAEATGLVMSSVSLLTLFQTCLSAYEQIHNLKFKSGDLDFFITCARFEHCKFSMLRSRLRALGIIWHVAVQEMIGNTLKQNEVVLDRLYKLLCSHVSLLDDSGGELSKPGNKFTRAFKWVASDQQKIERLLFRLKELNGQLEEFLPSEQLTGFHFSLIAQSVATTDITQLGRIQAASEKSNPTISLAAQIKFLRIENIRGMRTDSRAVPKFQITDFDAFKWALLEPGKVLDFNASLHDVVGEDRAVARYVDKARSPIQQSPVLVEWRSGFRSTSSIEGHKYRLDQLVLALSSMGQPSSTITTTSSPSASSESQYQPKSSPGFENNPSLLRRINFGTLECMGWLAADHNFSNIALVFRFPPNHYDKPRSLYENMKQDRRMRKDPPALGTRFAIATQLVERVANLIAVGWVHNSMRSDNVIIFDHEIEDASSPPVSLSAPEASVRTSDAKDQVGRSIEQYRAFEQMYLTGFSYARPGDPTDSASLSSLPSHDPAFALYRPPRSISHKHLSNSSTEPSTELTTEHKNATPVPAQHLDASFDIYGLGIILLEIALWRTIDSLYRECQSRSRSNIVDEKTSPSNDMNMEQFQESAHLSRLVSSLDSKVGSLYGAVVRKCITLDGWRVSLPTPSLGPASPSVSVSKDRQRSPGQQSRRHDAQRMDEVMDGQFQSGIEVKFLEFILTSLFQCKA